MTGHKKKFASIAILCMAVAVLTTVVVCLGIFLHGQSVEAAKPEVVRPPTEAVEPPTVDVEYSTDSVFEALQSSNVIVMAVCLGAQDSQGHVDYQFSVEEVLYGTYGEETIYVCDYPDAPLRSEYEAGKSYLLALEWSRIVYYPHDLFLPVANLFVPLAEPERVTIGEGPGGEEGRELAENPRVVIQRVLESRNSITSPCEGTKFVNSSDLNTILGESDYVLRIEIGDWLTQNDNLGTIAYECQVAELLKGESADYSIYINFFVGTVEPGKEYIVAVNKVGPQSLVYALAAKENAVFSAQSEEADSIVSQLKDNGK